MLLIFLKIVEPGDLYDINRAFWIPRDNSPCIKYKHGIHGLQKEKWDMFSS